MRSHLAISMSLFIGLLGLAACSPGDSVLPTDPNESPATVTAVTVTPSRDTVVVGATVRLVAHASMSGKGSPPSVAWRSSSPTIANVIDGVVRGMAPGSTEIVAEAGDMVDTAQIWVVPQPPAPVASVTISPAAASLASGASMQLIAVVRDAAGAILTGRSITWASSASGVATVNASGSISAVAPGTASITATSEGRTASASITVTSVAASVASVSVTPMSGSVPIGQTLQLAATAHDANGNALGGHAASWASSNTAAASVSSTGLVTGIGQGSVQITVTMAGRTASASITITVPPAPVASVQVTPGSANLVSGQTVQLAATPRDAGGAPLSGRTVEWLSSNTNVATVNASGLVTGRGVGSATISASSEGRSGSATITATLVPVSSIVVSPASSNLDVGRTLQLIADIRDASGNRLSGRTVTWASSNTSVAAVSASGVVVGIGAGSAQITATCEGVNGTMSTTVTAVTVPGGTCGQGWPAALHRLMPQSTGQAFYVSPSGSDANAGTIDSPWKTLQKAFNTLQPGQIAYLRAGTYGTKCAASTYTRAGTADAPITVRGYPGERAVLNGQVRLEGSFFRLSYIVMEGPTCGNWGEAGRLGENLILMIPGKSHHIEVSHSEVFHGGWHAGVSVGGDDMYVLNNYIHDNGNFNDPDQYNTSHGIYYHDGARGLIANNIIEHNYAKGISARYAANHVLVVNNTIVGNGRSGIDITEDTHDWIMANNIIMNNGNTGIHTSGSSGGTSNILRSNVFWNNASSGSGHWHTNNTRIDNLVADPMLQNPARWVKTVSNVAYAHDYRLISGSPAIGMASLPYVVPNDGAGACRLSDGRADVGALEWLP